MLARASLGEEGAEAVVASAVGRQHAVRLDPVLHAVQLPAGVAHLTAGLANVDR